MSKMTRVVKEAKKEKDFEAQKPVTNFMGGVSFCWNPLDTLKMVTASSIFGEPAYYREGEFGQGTVQDGTFSVDMDFAEYLVAAMKGYDDKKTSDIMEEAIDAALDYDFKATLEWAVTLRNDFCMRLNPQVIMVRAAQHPKRAEFTAKYPGLFDEINQKVMARADEPSTQLTYYLYKNGGKGKVPGVLKRSWANRLELMSRYEAYKYRNAGIGMIDTVRICHAKGELIDELMQTGTVSVQENEKTWETMRANGASWHEILTTIQVGHMALLRNLRGIFLEIDDMEETKKILNTLKAGVKRGKQFPFRYMTAYRTIEKTDVNHRRMILDALEECMDIACDNMPKLKGRTMCLSDNSGSAWGTFNSEYGTVTVANIDNLSSVITARNSDEGIVGKFGDRLIPFEISKRDGVLSQTKAIDKGECENVGGGTECGIWLFFDKAIRNSEWYDNIFIYSDMQAGHGDLYGTSKEVARYESMGYAVRSRYINVAKLIDEYRRKVNPKANVFSVQTAGYDNVVIPENGYRTALLYGWTGKELVYADAINRFWDEKDAQSEKKTH